MSSIEKHESQFPGQNTSIKDEKGNVLIFSLLILVLVTMLGLSASRTASVDIAVAANNMNYKKNFYKAEANALEAIGRLKNLDLENSPPSWVTNVDIRPEINDDTKWDGYFTGGAQAGQSSLHATSTNSKYVVIAEGTISVGESLDMTRTKIYQYAVFGRNEEFNGKSIINIGYREIR